MFLEAILKEGKLSYKFIEEDPYKRVIMHCLIDRSDIGSLMVQMGMAEDSESYSVDITRRNKSWLKLIKEGFRKKANLESFN